MTLKPCHSQARPLPIGPLIPVTSLAAPWGRDAARPDPLLSCFADRAAGLSSSGMGSASPSLSSLPPSRLLLSPSTVLRTGPEKVTAGAAGPERRDWSPSPPATPEQGLPAFYLSCLDMLYPDDSMLYPAKGPVPSAHDEPPEEPEQCPVIDSQAPGGSLDLAPAGLSLEEHSLEQVQSMVVGEVLKDIETACKLLNIASGEPLSCPPPQGGGSWLRSLGGGDTACCTRVTPAQPQQYWCFYTQGQPTAHSCELWMVPRLGWFQPSVCPAAPAQSPHVIGAR